MRLFRQTATVFFFLLVAPAFAGETSFAGFPFETKAGTYRDMIVVSDASAPAGNARKMRLLFPSVAVERVSADHVILRPGQDRRVIVQTSMAGRKGFGTGAELYFSGSPVIMRRSDTRAEMTGTLKTIAVPLVDGPDAALGKIGFAGEGMAVAISWPTRPAPTLQTVDIVLGATGVQVDARLLSLPVVVASRGPDVGAIDLRGRVALRLTDEPAGMTDILAAIERIEIDRSRIALLGGGITASGVAKVSPGAVAPLTDLTGTLALGNFSTMVQQAMVARILAPEQLMPLALLAGGLGTLMPDGTLTFDIRTTAGGEVVVNNRPTAFRLRK